MSKFLYTASGGALYEIPVVEVSKIAEGLTEAAVHGLIALLEKAEQEGRLDFAGFTAFRQYTPTEEWRIYYHNLSTPYSALTPGLALNLMANENIRKQVGLEKIDINSLF